MKCDACLAEFEHPAYRTDWATGLNFCSITCLGHYVDHRESLKAMDLDRSNFKRLKYELTLAQQSAEKLEHDAAILRDKVNNALWFLKKVRVDMNEEETK